MEKKIKLRPNKKQNRITFKNKNSIFRWKVLNASGTMPHFVSKNKLKHLFTLEILNLRRSLLITNNKLNKKGINPT